MKKNMCFKIIILTISSILILLSSSPGFADEANETYRAEKIYGYNLEKIASDGNSYIAIGDNEIYYSKDLDKWKSVMKIKRDYCDIIWNGKEYIAVNGTNTVYLSEDGLNWRTIDVQIDENIIEFSQVVFGNDTYIFYTKNYNHHLYVTKDLKNWTKGEKDVSRSFHKLFYTGDKWISLGDIAGVKDSKGVNKIHDVTFRMYIYPRVLSADELSGEVIVESSKDGLSWNRVTETEIEGSIGLYSWSIIWDGERFIAVENHGRIITSQDGLEWKEIKYERMIDTYTFEDIAYHNGMYILTARNSIYVTKDFKKFNKVFSMELGHWIKNMTIINDELVAIVDNSYVIKSKDGVTWQSVSKQYPFRLKNVMYVNDKYIAVSEADEILISNDGVNWDSVRLEGKYYTISDIQFFNDMYVVIQRERGSINSNFSFFTSKDGINWTKVYSEADTDTSAMKSFINNKHMIISNGGRYYISTDGIKWTKHELSGSIIDVLDYNESTIIFYRENEIIKAKIYDNTDKSQTIELSLFCNWQYSFYTNGDYILYKWNKGHEYQFHKSENILNWSEPSVVSVHKEPAIKNEFHWNENKFMVFDHNKIYTSKDGMSWNIERIIGDNFSGMIPKKSIQILNENELILICDGSLYKVTHEIGIKIDGEYIDTDVSPYIENGVTMVPLRSLLEKLGMDISWDAENQEIICTTQESSIVFTIGSTKVTVDGKEVKMPLPPAIKDASTMIPIRFLVEELGAEFNWNESSKLIDISFDK